MGTTVLVIVLYLLLEWWLPLVSEISSTARFALVSLPDFALGWALNKRPAQGEDIIQQLSKYGASTPASSGAEEFSMDK